MTTSSLAQPLKSSFQVLTDVLQGGFFLVAASLVGLLVVGVLLLGMLVGGVLVSALLALFGYSPVELHSPVLLAIVWPCYICSALVSVLAA